jgi:hypothetical protein
MNGIGNNWLTLLAVLCGVSCLARAAEAPSFESLREAERLWMGLEEGVIRPAAYAQIRAETEGYVALHAGDRTMLRKGEHWATIDPAQLDLERRALALDESKQQQTLEKGREDLRDARLRMTLELHEAQGQREALKDASGDEELSAMFRQRVGEAMKKLDEQISTLTEKLDPAVHERDLRLLEEDNALQLARKQKQFVALEKRSSLVAGSAGELRIGDPLKEKLAAVEPGEPAWMSAGDLLGTIVDDRNYEISVAAAGPLLSEIPREQLLILIQDSQTGKLIAGEYNRTEEIDSGREISRNFVFTIPDGSMESARQAQGTRNLVHVYRKFPRPYKIIFKKDIAFSAPEVLDASGWDGLVRHLYPGSKVIQVGPQTIAVEPKDAS